MSDDQSGGTGTPASTQDPIKNVKSEFDRKLEDVKQTIEAQNRFYAEQFNNLQQVIKENRAPTPAAAAQTEKDLEKLSYDDPAAYARVVKTDSVSAAEAAANKVINANNARQNMIVRLVSDYPELSDQGSAFYSKVVSEAKKLGENYAPDELRLLVRELAADEGLLPKTKRGGIPTDGFSFGGSRDRIPSERSGTKTDLTPETLEFASRIGLKLDEKTVKNMEGHAKRNWTRYK